MPQSSGKSETSGITRNGFGAVPNHGSRRRVALGIPPVPPEPAPAPERKKAFERKPHHIALVCLVLLGSLLALVLVLWQPGTKGQAVADIVPPEAIPEIVKPIDIQPEVTELPIFEPDPAALPVSVSASISDPVSNSVSAPVSDLVSDPVSDFAAPPVPAWQQHAVKVAGTGGAPRLAIIIDDMGLDRGAVKRAAKIRGPLTLAFLPYAHSLPRLTRYAHDHGHELMVHLPMEPTSHNADPGPNALLLDLEPAELKRRIIWNLDRFDGFVGANNHMGSLFTADEPAMRLVLEEIQKRGLLYVDSRTTMKTVGERVSKELGIPTLARDIFLDNEEDEATIREQLRSAVSIARKYGSAVAIGHPYNETLSVLETDLPKYQRQGIVMVPVSALMKHPANILTAEQTSRD